MSPRLHQTWNRLTIRANSLIMISLLAAGGLAGQPAQRVVQFEAWGTAGPASPPAPAGWTEAPAEPSMLAAPVATPEEKTRGFVVFTHDPFSPVGPHSVPAPAQRAQTFEAMAARGQYEPFAIGLYALEDLAQVRLSPSELRAADGAIIPLANLEVRVVRSVRVPASAAQKRYRWEPFLLEKRGSFPVPKETAAVVWLTVKVSETATAGLYAGSLAVQATDHTAVTLDLRLQVLPFLLPPAPIEMVLYYPRPAESDTMLKKELVDLREHGVVPIPIMEARVKSRDRKFGEDDVAETSAYCRRLMDATKAIYGGWRFPVTFEAGHQILYAWDPGRNWFAHWEHAPVLEEDFTKAVQLVADLAREYRPPGLRLYVNDEAGAHNLLDEAIYDNRLVKQRFPQIATTTTIGGGLAMGYDEIGQLKGVVDFFSANRFTPEVARSLLALGRPYGVYNGAGSTPAGARFFFGFYGWKTSASQVGQWVYSFGESIFTGNGLRQEDEGYVYHAADGPLPSLMSEAVRAGVDDYRYLHLLWQMIGAARASAKPGARAAADEAEQVCKRILGQIGWGFQALQSGDRTPPPPPSTLRKWRWQVAQQIRKLGDFVPVTADQTGQRPGPLDWPWRETPPEPVQFGPEMLPPSDFETALKPWRVEAWNGKGQGQLASDEKHSGRQSVRLEVPAASGNGAVTVLVWPQYGDGKLNLSLEGERAYEFAAWVKSKDRGVPPELRVNVPASVVASTRTGKGPPAPDGWQRFWTRVALKAPAQPTYLAVWMQGPGTVWVDDLSLREVIPPPLTLTLDQSEYDAADKTAFGTVAVAKLVRPAQLRVSLNSTNRGLVEEMTVPFASQFTKSSDSGLLSLAAPADLSRCRFMFNPSTLAAGAYECQVRLLDAEGHELARQSAPFERIPDSR
jgi:hypothetical protein